MHYKLEKFGIIAKGEHRVINEFQNGDIYMIEKNKPIDFVGEVTILPITARAVFSIFLLLDYILKQAALMDIEKKKEIVIQKTRQELYEECGISQKRSINGSNRDDRSPSERVRFSSSFDILHHFWPYQEYRVPSADSGCRVP